MGTLGWLLVVAVGIALGFSVGRLWPGSAAKITELERQRDAAHEDLRTYRKDVSTHFERTAELFDKVTADYRGLYEHLALGARQLSAIRGEAAEQRLAEPEQRRLATVAVNPATPAPENIEPYQERDETTAENSEPGPEDDETPADSTMERARLDEDAFEETRAASPDPDPDPNPEPEPTERSR